MLDSNGVRNGSLRKRFVMCEIRLCFRPKQDKTEAFIHYTIRVLLLLLTTKLLLQPPHAFTITKTLYKLKLLAIRFV